MIITGAVCSTYLLHMYCASMSWGCAGGGPVAVPVALEMHAAVTVTRGVRGMGIAYTQGQG